MNKFVSPNLYFEAQRSKTLKNYVFIYMA